MNKYTVDYFIEKFAAIPDSKWLVGNIGVCDEEFKCALGFCGIKNAQYYPGTTEAQSLAAVLGETQKTTTGELKIDRVWGINDGCNMDYRQPTPKQRILAALYDIKKLQQPTYENISKQLAVFPIEETSDLRIAVEQSTQFKGQEPV